MASRLSYSTIPGFSVTTQFVLLYGNTLKLQTAKISGPSYMISISLKLQLTLLEHCDVANHSRNVPVSR